MTIQHGSKGFTLIETVVVIVITGIVAGIVALFIRAPVEGYADMAARAEMTDIADTALRRIARDVRLALPNSIRIKSDGAGNQYLELLLTKTGGRYLSEDDGATAGNILDFTNPDNMSFTVVGAMPAGDQAIVPGSDQIVVFNLGAGFMPADAYNCAVRCNRATVKSVDAGTRTITLTSNPFALQSVKDAATYPDPVPMPSPARRFQVVSTPVSYVCIGGQLRRYWGYAIQAAQPTLDDTLKDLKPALLATKVGGCAFSYNSMASLRNALVGLRIGLQDIANSRTGTITLFHQVHVDNTP